MLHVSPVVAHLDAEYIPLMADTPSPDELSRGAPLSSAGATWGDWLRLVRPRQWTKNLLLFAALVFAQKLFDLEALALAMLAFGSFCLAASSVYIVNDVLDSERDRRHPEKSRRPIAAGAIPERAALGVAIALGAAALALAFAIAPRFGLWALAYLGMNAFYSTLGKSIPILDVMLVASGFVIRAIAGAAAIDVPYSEWFIMCTLFLAIFLSASKRKAELLALTHGAEFHRPVLGKYTTNTLDAFTTTSMAATVLSYALYVMAEHPGEGIHLLALTVPFVIFGVFRYSLLVETGDLGDKPEEVLLRDRPMQLCIVCFSLVAVAALYMSG
jgi:4-hydroxybenzoate polyprenyltransferase